MKNKELTYDELPVEIQKRMLLEQEKQGNERNPDVFRKNLHTSEWYNGFDWNKTEDGYDFWASILREKDFDCFFLQYPKKEEELLELEEEKKPSLNLIELLTNAPTGLPLYSTVLGPCTLERVESDSITVIAAKESYFQFTPEGKLVLVTAALLEVSECTLFPSKNQRNWDKFVVEPLTPGELVWAKDGFSGTWVPRRYAYTGYCYRSQVEKNGHIFKPVEIRAWDDCPFKDMGYESKIAQNSVEEL